jgi:serine protease
MINTALAYDFVANRKGAIDPMDYSGNPGHGTGTASVVASRDAGKIAGAAPLATLVPLRAVTSVVVFDHGRVAAAVEYARRKGANVITMSLGGAWSSALRAAIGQAIAQGIIVLAAAGNCVGFVVWPALRGGHRRRRIQYQRPTVARKLPRRSRRYHGAR